MSRDFSGNVESIGSSVEELKRDFQKNDAYYVRLSLWINYLLVLRKQEVKNLPNLDNLLFDFVRNKIVAGEIDKDQLQKVMEKRLDELAAAWLSSQLKLGEQGLLFFDFEGRRNDMSAGRAEAGSDPGGDDSFRP